MTLHAVHGYVRLCVTGRLALVALTALVIGCSGSTATPEPVTPEPRKAQAVEFYVRVYGGLAGAYWSVLEETDCAALQDLFYTATENETLGYQAAIDDRSHDLDCPTLRFNRP